MIFLGAHLSRLANGREQRDLNEGMPTFHRLVIVTELATSKRRHGYQAHEGSKLRLCKIFGVSAEAKILLQMTVTVYSGQVDQVYDQRHAVCLDEKGGATGLDSWIRNHVNSLPSLRAFDMFMFSARGRTRSPHSGGPRYAHSFHAWRENARLITRAQNSPFRLLVMRFGLGHQP